MQQSQIEQTSLMPLMAAPDGEVEAELRALKIELRVVNALLEECND